MNLTTLFRLRKPEGTDPVNIEDFNDNFDVIDTELGKRPLKTDPASNMTVAFTQAANRANLTTGEKLSVSLGKVMKFFADLKTVAFSGSYADLSNKPSIPSGTAADCQVVDDVDDIKAITQPGYVPGTLPLKQVISDLGGCQLSVQEDGAYITYTLPGGADPVSRKLGEPTVIASGLVATGAKNIDCTAIAGYQNLTVDNFILRTTGLKSGFGSNPSFGINGSLTKTYNPDTGVLTVGKCFGKYYDYSGNNYGAAVVYDVLLA